MNTEYVIKELVKLIGSLAPEAQETQWNQVVSVLKRNVLFEKDLEELICSTAKERIKLQILLVKNYLLKNISKDEDAPSDIESKDLKTKQKEIFLRIIDKLKIKLDLLSNYLVDSQSKKSGIKFFI
jgi:hypothetical protein